jgi:hypothetical protein
MLRHSLATIRLGWTQARWYRRLLTITLIFVALRLLLQGFLLLGTLMPEDVDGQALPDDLRIYLDAAVNLKNHQNLYPDLPLVRMEFYQYSPAYTLAFVPFTWLSRPLAAFLHSFLHIGIYVLLYLWWGRIFRRLQLEKGSKMLVWTLPLWLVFSTFWSDLGFLNVYILTALLATLLIDAILVNRLGWSVVWLTIILQIKPQWAFAAALPLLLGNWRFFLRLLILSAVAYAVAAGVTCLLVGWSYGIAQYSAYLNLLGGISATYPWRVPGMPFLGYNHSIMQTFIYWLGDNANVRLLATVVKLALLAPTGVLAIRFALRPVVQKSGHSLELAFLLYLAAFIWLDVVWELALGIAVFTYLAATIQSKCLQWALWLIFLPYALVDVIQVVSYIVFGDGIIAPGPYILTDPSIYVPIILFTLLVFYAVLVVRLWRVALAVNNASVQPALVTTGVSVPR